jgi:hypothetical protein
MCWAGRRLMPSLRWLDIHRFGQHGTLREVIEHALELIEGKQAKRQEFP